MLDYGGPEDAGVAATIERLGGVVKRVRPNLRRLADVAPERASDVAVAVNIPDHGSAVATSVVAEQCPVVLITQGQDEAVIARARQAGIMACLLLPVRAEQLATTLDLAIARFQDLRRLRRSLRDRPDIDRAKRHLMAQRGITEDEAYRQLRRWSMDRRQPLGDVARALLSVGLTATITPAS
jgi:AmiR/NasT family two-component response regulator